MDIFLNIELSMNLQTLMSVLKNVQGDPGKTKKQSSGFNLFNKLRSRSKEDVLAKSNEKLTGGRAKSLDNLNDRARGLLLLSKGGSRLANMFGRRGGGGGANGNEEKLVRDDESMSQTSDKRDPYAAATVEKDKAVEEQGRDAIEEQNMAGFLGEKLASTLI